ncbi:CDP-alcohol phosphatidyltransferase family protein [Acaryochloris sp. 'Moss Beach']|uniref:CDP-alcohol phosphatidyltransferase family protein n=1 Tax=Acaryochloris sp. 'Moss Beach' TaxID=2740837 RepID=UPI001F2A82FF|nr:CDP-alcohol phosphatidyltransferase family protein [Acaryochloris sp. 'Moss Beach']UJB70690.1 CDP-alcohol phosphatidyltransferase family protein [Acaryochloris sp. 'Moss Beach']
MPNPSTPVQDSAESQDKTTITVPLSPLDRMVQFFTIKLARSLARFTWITPNRVTWVSAGIGGPLTGWLIIQEQLWLATALVVVSGLMDGLDGDIARERNLTSIEGGILDSVLDRYIDFFLIAALILVNPTEHLLVGLFALLGTTMVPYIRARSEVAGKSSIASIGSRATRIVLIILGLLTQQLFILLIALAVISNIAAVHRFWFSLIPVKDQPTPS